MNTYYNYKQDKEIATDIETRDPYLTEKGPGVYRKDGYVIGISFSNGELSEYYPIQHPDTSPELREKNLRYIKDQLAGSNDKIFANAIYDLDWLKNGMGLQVNGKYQDIQLAEPLLDEYKKSYSLNNLAIDYLGQTKAYDGIKDYAVKQGWIKETDEKNAIKYVWQMPGYIVQEYGAEDTALTYKIFQLQKEKLSQQELWGIYDLETRLLPLLLQMRRVGVRIDEEKLRLLDTELSELHERMYKDFIRSAGFNVNINSGKDLERLFLKKGFDVIYGEPTAQMKEGGLTKGNPKFDKAALTKYNNTIAKDILSLRHITTLLNLFIRPYPDFIVNGRIHSQFHQLRSDNYGTVSSRFSGSNPNLQQISSKDEEDFIESDNEALFNGQIIRKLFIPEDGCDWLKYDWSQIEYRLLAHYAIGEGADYIRKRYNDNPDTDYHVEMMGIAGINDRKTIKTFNFGGVYGMGVYAMSQLYGWDIFEAKRIYNNYHNKVPFVKETSRRVGNKAKRVGFVKTILGRRSRLPSPDKAYVMINRLIQSGCADLMKKAMVDAYEAGIFNVLSPHITVHDEIDSSKPRTKEGLDAAKELKYIMENCITLRVPIIADGEIGPSWGELKGFEL